MKKPIQIALLFIPLLLGDGTALAAADESANWQLRLTEDPLSNRTVCLMISVVKHTEDGQTTTPVTIIYNGDAFIAKTESNIDLSYSNSGLQVDFHKAHNIDRVHKNTNVVFVTDVPQIVEEFKKGLVGRLTLGFWPTWPKSRSYTVEFDLRGFSRTYKAFRLCQNGNESH